MEWLYIISFILSAVTLVCFFMLCYNVSQTKKILENIKSQNEKQLSKLVDILFLFEKEKPKETSFPKSKFENAEKIYDEILQKQQ